MNHVLKAWIVIESLELVSPDWKPHFCPKSFETFFWSVVTAEARNLSKFGEKNSTFVVCSSRYITFRYLPTLLPLGTNGTTPICRIVSKFEHFVLPNEKTENTHVLHKGNYHCTADLLFDWLGFSCFANVELDRDLQVWSNPNQSNRRSAVQWYFPLWWVFSALALILLPQAPRICDSVCPADLGRSPRWPNASAP